LSETYAYDRLGNLRVKAGVGYEYPAARQPRPHAPIRVGGQPYAYDANGNLTSGGGRTFVWNGWNQLASVSQAGVTETYADDAAGARVTRTSNGATVVTVADLWERTVGGATTHFYRFGADVIGVRRSDQGTQYLFSDHLGERERSDERKRRARRNAALRPVGTGAHRRHRADGAHLHWAAA
jgi:hypothetical protein